MSQYTFKTSAMWFTPKTVSAVTQIKGWEKKNIHHIFIPKLSSFTFQRFPLLSLPPCFCTPPLGMFFFYWHFSSICCINCSSVQEQGSRAQYGASNYLCPLCARATKYLTNPYGAGCRLTWCAG